MTRYATLVEDARGFYGALAENNNRDWWLENKAIYDSKLKAAALSILEELQPYLAELSDMEVATKLFRPHRDVRFSKDKTPYQTHLHMMWHLKGEGPQSPVFFFGIGLDYVTAGAGMMGFDKSVLLDWRKFVDLDTDRVMGIVDTLRSDGAIFREPELKRVPSPFDKEHRAADLLRMKGVVAHYPIAEDADLVTSLKSAFERLWPLNALLLQVTES